MEEGLCKVLPQAERLSFGKSLFDAEEKAREAKKNLWEVKSCPPKRISGPCGIFYPGTVIEHHMRLVFVCMATTMQVAWQQEYTSRTLVGSYWNNNQRLNCPMRALKHYIILFLIGQF